MNLPFTTEQFLSVFERYNQTVWPFQIILNLFALAAVYFAVRPFRLSDKIVAGILAFLWVWIGAAYHLAFFASINPAAVMFGVVNIVQGLVFLFFGLLRPWLGFRYRTNVYTITGAFFILYALVLYPLLGSMSGHAYPRTPTFGLPCPTTIFTFGLLLWTSARVPRVVLVIPFLWSLLGFTAALSLGIREDIGLLVAGIVGSALLIYRDSRTPKIVTQA